MASSDELLDSTNADIPAESQDKSKTEFINRVKKIKSEIKTKFQNTRKKLDNKELKILKKVEEIEKEIMDDYEKNAITLKEITQAKEQLFGTFKSNTTIILLKKNLEIIDKEIEDIKENSKIDSTIELVWKMEQLDLSQDDMCEVSINIKSSAPKIPLLTQITAPLLEPSSDVPPRQGFRRTLEGQYNTGASVSQSTTHGHSSGMQLQRQNEPNPNNFNVAAHPSSGYNHPRTYPQDPHSNAPMMYLQTGRDVPSELPFQQMQNQPIGLNPPSGASGWACPHCTFVNSSRSRVCEACYKTPDSKVEQPAVQTMQSQTQQKICPRCSRMNRMQEAVCLNCNASFV